MIDISNIGDINESKATQTTLHLPVNVNKVLCVLLDTTHMHNNLLTYSMVQSPS